MKKTPHGMRVASVIFATLVAPFAVNCGGPNAIGDAIRPPTPVASTALAADIAPDAIACRPHAYAEPLLIDMPTLWRADFEGAMNNGVALISYDCKSLKLVKGCHLKGTYGFAGIDRLSDVIHLEDATQIGANVPLPMGMSVGGSLERSTALDVSYTLVGKRSTPATVLRSHLEGDDCAAATHFVSAANVGAFSVKTATKGSGAVSANVLGASANAATQSGKETSKQAGDDAACQASVNTATTPPPNCGVAFKLELVPIRDAPAPSDSPASGDPSTDPPAKLDPPKAEAAALVIDDPCPDGFKLSAGKCAPLTSITGAHLCDPKDQPDCEAQCAAGDAGSCYNLAALVTKDAGHFKPDQADQRTAALKRGAAMYKRACDSGFGDGCWQWSAACLPDPDNHWDGTCKEAEAVAALDKGCGAGSSNACESLGAVYLRAVLGVTKDEAKGAKLYGRACDLGDKSSCQNLAGLLFNGWFVTRDPVAADKLLSQFCAQGDLDACNSLGYHLLGWEEPSPDKDSPGWAPLADSPIKPIAEIPDAPTRARALFAKTCEADSTQCWEYARVLSEADDPDARAKLTALCPDGAKQDTRACEYLGASLFDGKGGAADKKRGIDLMSQGDVRPLAFRAAKALKNGEGGVKKDAKRAAQIVNHLCNNIWDKDPSCEPWKSVRAKK